MFEEFASIMNLGAFSDEEKALIKSNPQYKIKANKIFKKARQNPDIKKCYFCGENVGSYCNSHSIPAFCLRNIATSGDVMSINLLIDNPLLKKESGINNAGTFKLICRDCDSKIFSDYENPDNYLSQPTQKMLAQIALKNNLKSISKRLFEIELYKIIESENINATDLCQSKNYVNNLDLREYIIGFNKAKKALENNTIENYYVCYYERLNYVVPIAFQSQLALAFDFNGDIINNLYNQSPEYKLKNINICVFPLKNESIIILFIENGDKRYRSFYKQFKNLGLDDRLLALTFIMFAYSEDIFFSKAIEKNATSCKKLCELGKSGASIISPFPTVSPMKKIKEIYDLNNRKNIPNLLSKQYEIKN